MVLFQSPSPPPPPNSLEECDMRKHVSMIMIFIQLHGKMCWKMVKNWLQLAMWIVLHPGKSSSRTKSNHVLLWSVSKSIKSLQVKFQLSVWKKYFPTDALKPVHRGGGVKNTWNMLKRCEIYSKVTIKTSERCHWCCFGVFITNFEHISNHFPVFLLPTLNKLMLVRLVLYITL